MAFDTITLIMCVFSFNDTATTEIYTLSLHDALPICASDFLVPPFIECDLAYVVRRAAWEVLARRGGWRIGDRKSTRLNSSHMSISYAVFCLKKKKISAISQQEGNESHAHNIS